VPGYFRRDHSNIEVHVFPAKRELFRFPEPRVQGEGDRRPLFLADSTAELLLFPFGEESHALIVLLKELHRTDRVCLGIPVGDGDVEETLQKRKFPVHARGCDFGDTLRNIALNITGQNLPERFSGKDRLPPGTVARVVAVAPQPALDPGEVVVNGVGKCDLAAAEVFRKKAAFLNLRLALLVDLLSERFGPDLLPVEPSLLVGVADPPDSRVLGPLEDAALASAVCVSFNHRQPLLIRRFSDTITGSGKGRAPRICDEFFDDREAEPQCAPEQLYHRNLELTRSRGRCWGEMKKEAPMPRTHPPYAPEYRRRVIELARSGRPIAQLAREFEASANAIRKWVKQTGLDEGLRSDGLTTAERDELNRLRRENRVLREEREILSKAAAWFATETGSVPSRRSNS
jgi:transposase